MVVSKQVNPGPEAIEHETGKSLEKEQKMDEKGRTRGGKCSEANSARRNEGRRRREEQKRDMRALRKTRSIVRSDTTKAKTSGTLKTNSKR